MGRIKPLSVDVVNRETPSRAPGASLVGAGGARIARRLGYRFEHNVCGLMIVSRSNLFVVDVAGDSGE